MEMCCYLHIPANISTQKGAGDWTEFEERLTNHKGQIGQENVPCTIIGTEPRSSRPCARHNIHCASSNSNKILLYF